MSSENINILMENKEPRLNNLDIEENYLSTNSLNIHGTKQTLSNKKFAFTKKLILFPNTNLLFLFSLIFLINFAKSIKINPEISSIKQIRVLESKNEEKKNIIKLKFNCKNPKNPVQLFNSSSQIENHIELLEVAGTIENITDRFTFGFSGKYQVKLHFKDKLTSIKNLFSGCSQLMIADFSDFISDEVTDMSSLFEGCLRLKYVEFGDFKKIKLQQWKICFVVAKVYPN